ncbi:MAG TPA: outer membrane beta-barrel protein [Chitinophagaceae bacterium]
MKKITLLIILLIACYCFSSAQTASVKGVIFDTINQKNLVNRSVSLLRQKDSVLYKLTHSDAKGFFELKNLLPGNYLLFVRHPGYEDYIDHLQLNDSSKIDLGTVTMTPKAIILKEVIVRKQISAIIKGDTIEFAADSFKAREGASVEEMLKKLPGIQIDKNGTITAMGEKVIKVFVDGEEFFGDDPTIATKNLQADAVDKIQVFDKKSDQATFTGIDDGERSKTINLQLKKDKKKGYFGKLDLGAGFNDKWNNNAMINSFRDKKQFSVYGTMSTTDVTGLNLQQSNQYTSDNDPEFNNNFGGFASFVNNDNGFNNSFSYGEGVPESWAGGLNYSNKFNDQQSINGSYRYNKINSEGYDNTFSQSILPDTVFVNSESNKTFSSRQTHSFNGIYEWQIDSSTSIKIRANGYKGISNNINSYTNESRNEFGNPVNNSIRNTNANGDNQNLQSSFLIRKKFKKPGRTISFNLEQKYNENKTDGFLYSLNSFFDQNGIISLRDTTDQKKVNESLITTLNGKIIYTEPLSKIFFVELIYAFHNSRSDAQRLSFDKDLAGKYESLNDTFSNHYNFNVVTNIAGVAFKYNGKKVIFSFGSNIAKSNFNQKDLLKDASLKRNFTNFFPKAILTYKFNQSGHLSIIYTGNTRQPSINQIQPVPDNSNPLSIIIGNPLLKQEFDHSINFNFNSFNLLSQRGIFFYGSFSFQSNAIVTNNFTDTLGRTVYKYVNANGNYNYNSGFNYFINFEKLGMNVNTGLDFNKSYYSNVVNDKKNVTNNTAIAINLGINKDKEKKYNFYYNGTIRYNISTSSIRKDIETKYWIQEHSLDLTLMLPWKFELNNELQGSLQQKTALLDGNNNILLWNAYFGKKFLKNDKAIIKIIAHDILNQNTGYSRYISSNVIQETNYQSIARYFLLSFVWNFSKNPATSKAAPNP